MEARSYLQGDKMGEVLAEARMARGELQPGQPGFEQRMLSLLYIILYIYYRIRMARGELQLGHRGFEQRRLLLSYIIYYILLYW